MNVSPKPLLAVLAAAGAVAAFFHPGVQSAHADRFVATSAVKPSGAGASVATAPGATATVYVVGEVRRPGVYRLAADARVDAALRAAGETTSAADAVAVNRAAVLHDGEEIVVPARGASNAHPPTLDEASNDRRLPGARRSRRGRGRGRGKHHRATSGPQATVGTPSGTAAAIVPPPLVTTDARPRSLLDPNGATEGELAAVPGIGPLLAEKIVAFRTAAGPFEDTGDLLDVSGMTPARLERAEPYLRSIGRSR